MYKGNKDTIVLEKEIRSNMPSKHYIESKEVRLDYRNSPNAQIPLATHFDESYNLRRIGTSTLFEGDPETLFKLKAVTYKSPMTQEMETYFFPYQLGFYGKPHHTDIAIQMLSDIDNFTPINTRDNSGRYVNEIQITEKFSDVLHEQRNIHREKRPLALDFMGFKIDYDSETNSINYYIGSQITGFQCEIPYINERIGLDLITESIDLVGERLSKIGLNIDFQENEGYQRLIQGK
jgi:hypothetical protein